MPVRIINFVLFAFKYFKQQRIEKVPTFAVENKG
jgi:hypothetical protein